MAYFAAAVLRPALVCDEMQFSRSFLFDEQSNDLRVHCTSFWRALPFFSLFDDPRNEQ